MHELTVTPQLILMIITIVLLGAAGLNVDVTTKDKAGRARFNLGWLGMFFWALSNVITWRW